MKLLICILTLVAQAWGAACSLTLTANTNLSATAGLWTGGCATIPGSGDTAIVTGAFTLVVDQAWTIGTDTTAVAVELQGGAKIQFAASAILRAAGLKLNGSATGWEALAGATLTCQSGAAVCYIDHAGATAQPGKTAKLTGTSWSGFAELAFVKTGAASAGTILGTGTNGGANGHEVFTIRYGKWSTTGVGTDMPAAAAIIGVDWDRFLVYGNALIRVGPGGSGDRILSLKNGDFRNPNASVGASDRYFFSAYHVPAIASQPRIVQNVVFQGLSTGRGAPIYNFAVPDMTFTGIVTDNASIMCDTNRSTNWSITNLIDVGIRPDKYNNLAAGDPFNISPQANVRVNKFVSSTYCTLGTDDGCSPHRIDEAAVKGLLTTNTFSNWFVDGWRTGVNTGSYGGDTVVNGGQSTLTNAIQVRGAGNIEDGYLNQSTSNPFSARHITSVATSSQFWPAFVIAEQYTHDHKMTAITEALFVNEPVGVSQGNTSTIPNTPWVPQANFTLDYNGYWNTGGVNSYMSPATGNVTYLGVPQTAPLSVTPSVVSVVGDDGAGHQRITISGTWPAGTAAGDVLCAKAGGVPQVEDDEALPREPRAINAVNTQAGKCAIITTVDSTSQVTLGIRLGTLLNGIEGATIGDNGFIYIRYWNDSSSYGDPGRGSHDINADPQFVEYRNMQTWGATLGATGTPLQIATQIRDWFTASNGWDRALNRTPPNPNATVDNILTYIWEGYTPRNRIFWCAGSDGESIGAVEFCRRAKAINGATLTGM